MRRHRMVLDSPHHRSRKGGRRGDAGPRLGARALAGKECGGDGHDIRQAFCCRRVGRAVLDRRAARVPSPASRSLALRAHVGAGDRIHLVGGLPPDRWWVCPAPVSRTEPDRELRRGHDLGFTGGGDRDGPGGHFPRDPAGIRVVSLWRCRRWHSSSWRPAGGYSGQRSPTRSFGARGTGGTRAGRVL